MCWWSAAIAALPVHAYTHSPAKPPTYKNLPDLPSNWTWGEEREWEGVAGGGWQGVGGKKGVNVTFLFPPWRFPRHSGEDWFLSVSSQKKLRFPCCWTVSVFLL